jgi:hypothetical protein
MDFAQLDEDSNGGYLLSALEGLFYLRIPDDPTGEWPLEKIADGEHSDAFAYDWGQKGQVDIFTISPFHGELIRRYRKSGQGWEPVTITDTIQMGHIVQAGSFLGRDGLFVGERKGPKELRLYRNLESPGDEAGYEIIDEGIGPTQMAMMSPGDKAAGLLVAGHARDQVLLYRCQV